MISNFTNFPFRLITLVLLCSCYIGLNKGVAQRDMILTQAGEELRCRIIDETPVRFVFAYLKDGKPYRSEIFKTLVASFKFNYYDSELPNADKLPEAMYRATNGADTQSPRALSSTVAKSDSKSDKRKRRQKKSEEQTEEKEISVVTPETSVGIKTDKKNAKEKDAETLDKPLDTDKEVAAQKNSESQQNSVVKPQVQVPKNEASEADKPQTTTVNAAPKKEPTVVRKAPNTTETNITKETPTTSADLPASGNRNIAKESKAKTKESESTLRQEEGKAGVDLVDEKPVESAINNRPTPDITETELPVITINQDNKFRVGIKGGIGNRLDNNLQTINSYDLYLEQLLRGWTLGADIAYFPNDAVGFGAIFTDFKSRNSDNEILYRNQFTGGEQIGSISNNRSVKFIGPALFVRKKLDYKTYVVLGLSPGYNFYRDRGSYDGVDYTFSGGGFGAASTLGIDFLLGNDIIGRDIILSFEAGYNYGKINALDYGDARGLVDLTTPLDVSRLDFTIGLRFIRFPKYFRLTSY